MAGEWEDLTLGDLGRVVTGKTPLTAVEENFGGQIPFVTPSDMDGRRTISTTARYLTEVGAESVKGSKIPAGSVMVSCIGSDMGKAVIAGRDCVTNQQINSIVVDDRFSSEFVYYNLSTRKDEIRHQAAGGSAQPILNKGDFSRLEITLPPLAEQKAIAAVLGALDDKIELNRGMNATLEAMARALFQSWFIDFDPVRQNADRDRNQPSPQPSPIGRGRSAAEGEGAAGLDFDPVRAKLDARPPAGLDPATAALFPDSFQDSELGHIPHGWEVVPLEALASIRGGKQLPTEDCLPVGKFTVFGANGIMGYATQATHEGFVIAFGRVGAYCGSIHWSLDSAWINNNASAVVPLRWPAFVLQSMLNIDFNSMRTGSAQPFIPNSSLASAKVLRPSPEVAEAFCRIVEPLRRQQADNDHQSRTLATLRDTLLPKLLSGELSVAALESKPEAAR